ncbi:MAG: F0F1 ATP synthase subunit epsilon [Alphaproteobacteria bacterium]|nr:F0F1 ATP synthase subunit epsilon [Alphaproteobacteria bacterium]
MPETKPALNPFGYNPPEESPKNGKIRVKLITPLFEATVIEADKVLLPALDGDILILPDRAPIFFSLRPGRMIVYNEGQEPICFLVSSGVTEVRRNLCPVMAWGGREDKINPYKIKEQLDAALKALPSVDSIAKTEALARINFFKMVLKELKFDENAQQTSSTKKTNTQITPEDLGITK